MWEGACRWEDGESDRVCTHSERGYAAWVRCKCGVDSDVICADACRCEVTGRGGGIHIAGGIVQCG